MALKQNQAKAEFDFDAQPGSGELTIRTGEILTILKEGIEGGWVEGRNSKGKVGLFPASYIKKIQTSECIVPSGGGAFHDPPQSSLRRSATTRRLSRSLPRATVSNVAKHVALATLSPALLNSAPPKSAPPPLPPLSAGVHPTSTPSAAPSYVLPPTFDPPQQQQSSSQQYSAKAKSTTPGFDAWDEDPSASATNVTPPYVAMGGHDKGKTAAVSQQQQDDDFDDDWSDDDEEVANGRQPLRGVTEEGDEATEASEAEGGGKPTGGRGLKGQKSLEVQSDLESTEHQMSSSKDNAAEQEFTSAHSFDVGDRGPGSVARSRSTGPDASSLSTQKQMAAGGTARMKNINRFSNFVKTGMESYILATTKFNAPSAEHHEIVMVGHQAKWQNQGDYGYTCMVTKPKKESKLKGLKSFIAYSLTCSQTGIRVSRRYKHFDWLHEQLANKYLLIPIPPLPEKQVAGLYEDDLIQHRRSILQLWVNKICQHPVLSQSEVWRHFMGCTDEARWKKGKRLAEKDEYVGGNFFSCITAPTQQLDLANLERQIEMFARSSRSLEESCRGLYERIIETQKRLVGPYKSNWQKLGQAFEAVGQSLDLDQSQIDSYVKDAIKTSAYALHKIGAQHEEHGKREQLLDFLYVTKGTAACIPDTVNILKTVLAKMRENERLQQEGKISAADAEAIRGRVDVCSYAVLAEITHQQEERDLDLSTALGSFFSQQAAFYHSIGNQFSQLAALHKPPAK